MKTLELYDPYAVAYAIATGVPLVKVATETPLRFVMDDTEGQASRALGQWRSKKAMVNATAFVSAHRHVRSLQFTGRQTAQGEVSSYGNATNLQ